MPLRILVDKAIIEVFVGGGRGVLALPVLAPPPKPSEEGGGTFLFVEPGGQAATVSTVMAWEMGCGWSAYP